MRGAVPTAATRSPHLDRAGYAAKTLWIGAGVHRAGSRAVKTDKVQGDRGRLTRECFAVSRANYLFTSESVSEGHPDKVCDQISDAILDAFIERDVKLGIADDSLINTRLGCETLCTTNKIIVAGEGRGQLFRKIDGMAVVDRELITESRAAW